MKKLICAVLCLALVLSMMACGGNKDYDRLADIQERGYIEVVTEPYFAPYEFIDPSKTGDEQYVGMDIMLAQAIADEIGVELRIVPLEFTAVQAGIADGKYDLALSAMAYSPARAEAMALSNVYMASDTGYGFLVREEDVDKYTDIASLADAVVITQSGSVQEGLYNDNVEACAAFKLVSSMTDGYLAVAEGKADVCIVATASAQLYADANGGLAIPDFRFEIDPNMNGTVAAAPPEGSDALMEVVNAVIADLSESGQIQEWYDEYAAYAVTLGIE
ncbi:MAG: transporter substrate-binding domain-containing protein [Clostridia bacterium]|nr:transporter substrate-binding domain-containing protein [Clostridia bacterium]